jgi:hypothetical protein
MKNQQPLNYHIITSSFHPPVIFDINNNRPFPPNKEVIAAKIKSRSKSHDQDQ